MNCNTTHYRANSSSVPGDPTGWCGGDRLVDDFDPRDDVDTAQWRSWASGACTLSVDGDLALSPQESGSTCGVDSRLHYDLTLAPVAIAIEAPSSEAEATLGLLVRVSGGDHYAIEQFGDTIRLSHVVDGGGTDPLASESFSLNDMARWRLGADGDDLVAETSPDGATWHELGRTQLPTGALRDVVVTLGAEGLSPGALRIDSISVPP